MTHRTCSRTSLDLDTYVCSAGLYISSTYNIWFMGLEWFDMCYQLSFIFWEERYFVTSELREANWLNCHAGLLVSLLIILKKNRWQEKQKILKFITLWYPEKRNRFHIIRYIYYIHQRGFEEGGGKVVLVVVHDETTTTTSKHQNLLLFVFLFFFVFEKHHSTERQVGKHGHQEPTINTSKSDIRK